MIKNQRLVTNVKYQKGFTLTEIVVVIAILVLITVVVYSVQVMSQRAYREGEISLEITQNGRIILERVSRELRQAKDMVTELPQIPDNPGNPPLSEIEFEDGHTPSPYEDLGSEYYYIRYYVSDDSTDLKRQYRVYCFDDCSVCDSYFRWDDSRLVDSVEENTHPCDLEEVIIGEYVTDLKFWGSNLINIFITLSKDGKKIDLETKIFGRNF